MKRSRNIGILLFLAVLSLSSINCGGGGGGGAGVPTAQVTDGPAITAAVRGFVQAIGSRDQGRVRPYLSQKLLAQNGGPGVLSTLLVWDFGQRIGDTTDDQSYVFSIADGAIYQPSSSLAEVTSTFLGRNGDRLTVVFELGKESGTWLIEGIRLTVVPGGSYLLSDYFPLTASNYWDYLRVETATPNVASYVRRAVGGPAQSLDGVTVFPLPQSLLTTVLPGLRGALRPQLAPGVATAAEYWGSLTGLSYYQVPEFNAGKPISLLTAAVQAGDVSSASFTRIGAGSPVTYGFAAEVGTPEPVTTQVAGFLALPITIRASRSDAANPAANVTQKTVLYFAQGVGPVSRVEYDPNSESSIRSRETLVGASVNGRAYTIANTAPPVVSSVAAIGSAGGIQITYNLADPDDQPCSLAFAYSIDGGTTWTPSAHVGGAVAGVRPAQNLSLVWHSATDLSTNQAAVAVRVTPNDGSGGTAGVSPAFAVLNSVAAPSVTQFQPANGAVAVARAANLVLTFSTPVSKGTAGTVTITRALDNSVFASLPIADPRISISSQTVTIDPPADFELTTVYDVTISATCFTDAGARPYAGIAGPGIWRFTSADDVPPTVVSRQPANGATSVATKVVLLLNFSENITRGITGDVVIRRTSDNSVFETIPVTDNVRVTIAGTQVTIDPTGSFQELTGYYVQIASTCFRDGSGNYFAGIADTTTWNFTSIGLWPASLQLGPPNGTTGVATMTILGMLFEQNVIAGPATGALTIYRGADDSVFESIPIGDPRIVVFGPELHVTPSATFAPVTEYYVTVGPLSLQNAGGQVFAGITASNAWRFTTGDASAPTLVSLAPANGDAGVASNANLVMTLSENVVKGATGTVLIFRSSDNALVESIDVTSAAVTTLGTTVTIDPVADLAPLTGFYVIVQPGAIQDVSGNPYIGIGFPFDWQFTTAP